MKRYILYILTTLFVFAVGNAKQHTSTDSSPTKRVLIIDSYQEEVSWSNNIALELENRLNNSHPECQVNIEHLNADIAVVSGALNISLRPILWSFAEFAEDHSIIRGYNISTMLETDIRPDVIVFIGDDGFLAYQNLGLELKEWANIPLVLCAVKDSIIRSDWLPEKEINFEEIIPIEERRRRERTIPKVRLDMLGTNPESDHKGGENIEVQYNITGVKVQLPMKQSLELIHQLIPNLKEITWVDDEYYSSAYAKRLLQKEAAALLPSVKITEMTHTNWNTDSIYMEMLRPDSNKAYLTYSLHINGLYSKKSDSTIIKLFNQHSTVPMFSMTERPISDQCWIGGYYECQEELVDKTANQIARILNGEPANSIPFETIDSGRYRLNQSLLDRYDLLKAASYLQGVEYINAPPTFWTKYEKCILISLLLLTTCVCLGTYYYHKHAHNKRVEKRSNQYKRLYDHLQNIYESIHINFALFDKKGDCIFCIIDGIEYPGHALENHFFSQNIFESPYLDEQNKIQILKNETINKEIVKDHLSHNGSSIESTYQLVVKALRSTSHQSARYIAICLDLTPIILNKKEKERYENLFYFASKFSHIGVAYYNNSKGTEKYVTDSWYQNLNEPQSTTFSPSYQNVIPQDREAILEYRQLITKGEDIPPFQKEIRVLDKNNREYWVEQHIFTRGMNNQYIIELNLNIDEQKQSEEVLKKAKMQAEQANVETEKFIQSINHEIRTPLNSIIGFSEIITYSNNKEGEQFIPLIHQNNHLLMTLIDNIIELSKIDSGDIIFQKEDIPIGKIIHDFTEYFNENLYKKAISLHYEISDKNAIISTDKTYLYQVISNILSNAIKFTESGKHITLGYTQKNNEHLFYIEDTGCGISEEELKYVFKRFEKVDSFIPGTGLGLPLCQRIIYHLGGQLEVESTLGKGSRFWWTIPL